jgi:hypothetical protein
MPCNSDYMNATDLEVSISQVLCLLDELQTKKPVNSKSSNWNGYHPKAYNKELNKAYADKMVAELCDRLKKEKNIKKYSLEMQLWWREHQAADKKRKSKEKKQSLEDKALSNLLDKLSSREFKLLKKHGLKI